MGDIFYNKTVTVFNQYMEDGPTGGERWQATILNDVRLIETQGANIEKSGISGADSASLYIRTNTLEKEYKEPKEWSRLEDKTDSFTLAKDTDFFVCGDMAAEYTGQADFFNFMKENFDGVYKITTVDRYDLIPHLEVGGK